MKPVSLQGCTVTRLLRVRQKATRLLVGGPSRPSVTPQALEVHERQSRRELNRHPNVKPKEVPCGTPAVLTGATGVRSSGRFREKRCDKQSEEAVMTIARRTFSFGLASATLLSGAANQRASAQDKVKMMLGTPFLPSHPGASRMIEACEVIRAETNGA